MKKTVISLFMIICLALTLSACGNNESGTAKSEKKAKTNRTTASSIASIDDVKSMGDAFAVEDDQKQFAIIDNFYICVFKLGDNYYRVRAIMPKDVEKKVSELDFTEENERKKIDGLVSPLAIEKIENLNENILDDDAIKGLIGKSGKDLIDSGWICTGYNLDDMVFSMEYNCFQYDVVFDGKIDESHYDDFEESEIESMKVKSVTCSDIGDATNIEE